MAFEQTVRTIDVEAGSVIAPYRFLLIAADGAADHAGGAQGPVDGISMEDADEAGKVIPMALPDGAFVKVEAGGVVAVGGNVSTDATGKAIATGAGNGAQIYGRAMDLGADGSIITIQFVHKGQINA